MWEVGAAENPVGSDVDYNGSVPRWLLLIVVVVVVPAAFYFYLFCFLGCHCQDYCSIVVQAADVFGKY